MVVGGVGGKGGEGDIVCFFLMRKIQGNGEVGVRRCGRKGCMEGVGDGQMSRWIRMVSVRGWSHPMHLLFGICFPPPFPPPLC